MGSKQKAASPAYCKGVTIPVDMNLAFRHV